MLCMEFSLRRLFFSIKLEDQEAETNEELVATYRATGDEKFYAVLWQRLGRAEPDWRERAEQG